MAAARQFAQKALDANRLLLMDPSFSYDADADWNNVSTRLIRP